MIQMEDLILSLSKDEIRAAALSVAESIKTEI
jgi:hypothetical protein